jgi:hypothetical protein
MNKDDKTKNWQLLGWLERSLDGALSAAEQAELETRLRDDPAALAIAAKALHQHAELRYDERLTHDLVNEPAATTPKRGAYFTFAALGTTAAFRIRSSTLAMAGRSSPPRSAEAATATSSPATRRRTLAAIPFSA